MSDSAGSKKPGGAPADITITNEDCKPDGAGMATLTALVTLRRISSEVICSGPEVLVDMVVCGDLVEQATSPTMGGGGVITHKYDWSCGGMACGTTYQLRARADICVNTALQSLPKSVPCPAC